MVPGMTVFGMRSLGQVVAELRGAEVPEAPPVAPMSGSRLLAWRGQERLEELDFGDLLGMDDAKYAVEVAAAGGHPLLLTGPEGRRQDQPRRAGPDDPARADPGGVPRADRHPLAGGCARARRRHAHDSAVLRAAPRRQQGQPDRRRERAGPAGRDQPCSLRRALPRRVPAVPQRCHRGPAAAAGERGDHGGATRGVGDAAGPVPARPRLQSLPVRRLHRSAAGQPVPLQRAAAARLPGADHRPDRRPDRHHPSGRAAEHGRATRSRNPSLRRQVRARVDSDPGSATPALPPRELAPQRPGPGCRTPRHLAAAAGGAAQPRGSRVRRPAEQSGCGARPPARLDHRRPAVRVLR